MVIKKPAVKPPLSMVEIVMRADVATIEAALEARRKIDALLAERAAAYERIAALEKQIDEVIGAPDEFVFPPPPMPVAPFAAVTAPVSASVASRPAASAPHAEPPAVTEESAPATPPHAAPASHAAPAGEGASAAKKSAASRNSNQN